MEDAWWYGATNAGSRIALIAATYADARDTMVEGESGLLALLPEGCLTTWNRSLGELTLYNGTRFKLFAGTEPDRLRGPQHHRCVIGDTLITMGDGSEKPIRLIRPGDSVMTRGGAKIVTASKMTAPSAQIWRLESSDGRIIIGTSDHPVYCKNRGWTPLSKMKEGDLLCVIDALNGAESAGINMRAAITNIAEQGRLVERTETGCIAQFIASISAQYQKGLMSITRMKTALTTLSTTLNLFPTENTAASIKKAGLTLTGGMLLNWRKLFTITRRVLIWSANGAANLSQATCTIKRDFVRINATSIPLTPASVLSVRKQGFCAPVYNLSVDGIPEYFANGILTHNCYADELAAWEKPDTWDQMLFGLRLGQSPKVVIATTPRPVPLVKKIADDPHTVLTRGSTFDNAKNLAPSALAQLRAKYEGTRLGRQELSAELLDDIPGALWTRDMIDAARKPGAYPDMARIVVAIDPSGTRGESDNGDIIGIVVAGKGVDGRGYVLADRSCKLSPAGWGRRAVEAYHEFRADRIVAERNFGGAMVEHVIRTADKTVSYAEVVASRGKVVRAEPVAALYEQGKVSHRGDLAALEDQMCQLGPEGYLGDGSPDRLDAMVWALSYLVLDGRKDPLVITDSVLQRADMGGRR